jgi:DNA (cytosine-5)-methyltransferase 1
MFKLVSLFSGGGGLDCGLEAVGFESRFCTDIDKHSCITLRHSRFRASLGAKGGLLKAAIVQRDINGLEPNEILLQANLEQGEADLLTGGPPCQSFSVFGRRQGLNDPRGRLVWQYLRILRGVRPRVFLFENVPGLLSIEGGAVFEKFIEAVQTPIDGCSYTVKKYVLEAARYGVPQFRTRVIIIGVLNGSGLPIPPDVPPMETHAENHKALRLDRNLLPFNTAGDALQGLVPVDDPHPPRNHIGRVHSEPIIERYRNLAYGERDPITRINKLHPERPSYTIIVGSDKGGGKGHVHPFDPREVTPRESARMQTFPDWWGFSGTSRHPIRQIGNAVPPVLAATIGAFLIEDIYGEVTPSRETVWQKLGQQHLLDAEKTKIKGQDDLQSSQDSLRRQPEQPTPHHLRANTKQSAGL